MVIWREAVSYMPRTEHAKHFYFTIVFQVVLSVRLVLRDESAVNHNCSAVRADKRFNEVVSVRSVVDSGSEEDSMSMIPFAPHQHFAVGEVCYGGKALWVDCQYCMRAECRQRLTSRV